MWFVHTIDWFTSGQTLVWFTEKTLSEFKAEIIELSKQFPVPRLGNKTWVANAIAVHDINEFFFSTIGQFETEEEAAAKAFDVHKKLEFHFAHSRFIEFDCEGLEIVSGEK
jgi:hypothetical protein